MKSEFHKKTWGSEEWLVNLPQYCGKILTVEKNKFCSLHGHKLKDETFYILSGSVKFEYVQGKWENGTIVKDGEVQTITLNKGESFHVSCLLLHRFTGIYDINQIIEISTQHFEEDSYRVEPSITAEQAQRVDYCEEYSSHSHDFGG